MSIVVTLLFGYLVWCSTCAALTCPKLRVFTAIGSIPGQFSDTDQGQACADPTNVINQIAARIISDTDPTKVDWSPVIYPAYMNTEGLQYKYDTSVGRGIANIWSQVSNYKIQSPGGCFILIGYSQGAQVMNEFLAQLKSDILHTGMIGAALIGDPIYNGQVSAVVDIPADGAQGTHDGVCIGAGANNYYDFITSYPLWATGTSSVKSWCMVNDWVCDSHGQGSNDGGVHGSEPGNQLPYVVQYLDSIVRSAI